MDTSFEGSLDSSSGGGLNKAGAGKFTLAASGYAGTGLNITISQGTLLTGAANLPSLTAFTLSGGTLATGTFSNTVGSLSVTSAPGSVIDFAGGGTPVLTIASQGSWAGLLQIWNWSGSVWSSGTGGQLKFADGVDGTLVDVSKIQFYSDGGGYTGRFRWWICWDRTGSGSRAYDTPFLFWVAGLDRVPAPSENCLQPITAKQICLGGGHTPRIAVTSEELMPPSIRQERCSVGEPSSVHLRWHQWLEA